MILDSFWANIKTTKQGMRMSHLRAVKASKNQTEGMHVESLMTPRDPDKVGPRYPKNGVAATPPSVALQWATY